MKLHELLAVESNLENQAKVAVSDLSNTFEKKRHLFEEKRVTFQPNTEGAQSLTETQSDIQSTVQKELQWVRGFLVKSLDASFQVAESNTQARADIVLEDDEVTLLTSVPATALLELEKRIAEIVALIKAVPTLDPAKGFKLDSARENIFAAREVTKNRTQKTKEVIVLFPATTQHPAQTQLIDKDVPIGKITEQEWSGLITPAQKSELLTRAEAVARAVRRARSRANEAPVDTSKKIGAKLLDFIFAK